MNVLADQTQQKARFSNHNIFRNISAKNYSNRTKFTSEINDFPVQQMTCYC